MNQEEKSARRAGAFTALRFYLGLASGKSQAITEFSNKLARNKNNGKVISNSHLPRSFSDIRDVPPCSWVKRSPLMNKCSCNCSHNIVKLIVQL